MSAPERRLCCRCRRLFIPTWGGWLCPACSRRVARAEAETGRQLTFADVFLGGTARA